MQALGAYLHFKILKMNKNFHERAYLAIASCRFCWDFLRMLNFFFFLLLLCIFLELRALSFEVMEKL